MKASKRKNVRERREAEFAEQLIQEVTQSVAAQNVWERWENRRSSPTIEARQHAPEPRVESRPVLTPAPVAAMEPEVLREPEMPVIVPNVLKESPRLKPATVLLSFEHGESFIGQHVRNLAAQLAARGVPVHVFGRDGFASSKGIHAVNVGSCGEGDILQQVQEFTRRVAQAFVSEFAPGSAADFTATGFEWTTIPALQGLAENHKITPLLSLHSLEAQRSDLTSEQSKRIQEIEAGGLGAARRVLVYDGATIVAAQKLRPDSAGRIAFAAGAFPVEEFNLTVDAGAVKARYDVGPVDPTILFIGDQDERHGPDLLIKAAATILKRNPQTRFIFIGDGVLQWPLRVHSRYLLLDYAVRIPGSIEGQALRELILAADIIVAPSREQTEHWPILAAWAAKKPVLATHAMTGGLLQHDQNAVLMYPNENSVVWGVERLLNDHELRPALGQRGYEHLLKTFGPDAFAAQIQSYMNAAQNA